MLTDREVESVEQFGTLVIQIPCLNEEETLPVTLAELPKSIPGIKEIKVLVIDDGSTDRTVEVAKTHGVDEILSLTVNHGLAYAFIAGLERSLDMGADVIVNTDADNQYDASCIPDLIKPIMEGRTDIVVGARDMDNVPHFSRTKKTLQRIGSWVVRRISRTDVQDVTSGFRAYNRRAAMSLHLFSEFTYTLETLIQAGYSNLSVTSVPIRTNDKLRESRLFKSIKEYVFRSAGTILRIYIIYQPLKVFLWMSTLFALPGIILIIRFLYFLFTIEGPTGHVQSLIFALIFLVISFNLLMIGIIADLIGANRRLLEKTMFKLKEMKSSISRSKNV